ncbi:ABC transporter ATP-binding protein [Marinactinospora thermotolerans]|uniref:ABC transporter n=1 Tax=Marinactinospora thermotolerans DSM 45154 TaxID=1122192 RepID=A0A1T4N8D0_9ACTN|nr:ABC transporter ATP-binding protein [Marinactinospora thermotolerans]SJZ75550.1 ABC transporter [Marinactinospora thermotolerans DSM 45154]
MEQEDPHREFKILPELLQGGKGTMVVIALLSLVSAIASLALPMVAAALIAALQEGKGLSSWAVAMIGVGAATAISGALSSYLLAKLGHRMLYRVRVRTMRHALGVSLRDARREGSGNLAARLTADASQLKNAVDIGPIQLPMAAITLLGTLVVMCVLDWVLLLITLAAFAVAIGIIAAVIVSLRRRYQAVQNEIGSLSEDFVAALDALPIIKACRAEQTVAGDLSRNAERVADVEIGTARVESLMVPIINLGQQIALVSVIIGGGARLVDGELPLSSFVAFLLYLLQLAAPLMMAVSGIATLQAGMVARKRFNDVFALPFEQTSVPARRSVSPSTPSPDAPALRFEDVTFGYDDAPVLRGVDFTVPRRGLTALVGLSGAGKTTVLGLTERFMTPDSGLITVFGRPQEALSAEELRGLLAYVDQGFTLLRDDIRGNLTLGLTAPPSDEVLLDCLDTVGLGDVVRALPDGLDTVLGGANDLSGGQRQRLALARALLSDARLVLLDEPTSQLDGVNEQRLRNAVDVLAVDRALLVVAHRISTVQHADHVIVLGDGRTVAEGTHEELLKSCPEYADLVRGRSTGVSSSVLV